MKNSSPFLIRHFTILVVALAALPAQAGPLLPLRYAAPELLAGALLLLAALGIGALQQRRVRTAEERSRALDRQLQDQRSAHGEAEDALAASHELLCRLVRQQDGVRDAERSRIARALHEELGHRLLGLRGELALQQAALRGTSPSVHDKLTISIGNLDAAIRTLRASVGALRPIAPGLGLRHAAERHVAEFARLHALDYRLDAGGLAAGDAGRDRELDAVLFRALQEALSNVACHAQASTVRVTLVDSATELSLVVEDDGIGLPAAPREGCGLEGMRERAAALNGSVRLANGRRGGTVLRVSLPVRSAPATA